MAKLTTEEFIKKAQTVHGDKYDYSKVEYERMSAKICIIWDTKGSGTSVSWKLFGESD